MIDDTLSTNIAFGVEKENIDRDKVIKIMKLTELDKDFSPENLIGENGSLLSGGQKQKIAISRALYKDPQILIFDEPTSSLDMESEIKFIDNFLKKNDKTIILISHREEPLKNCDLLYELIDGKIEMKKNYES